MTYPTAPGPSGPAGPVTAGPGGAYGVINSSAPAPGAAPPAPHMEPPGSIKGIQVILWIMAVLSAAGELLSIVSLVEYFHPIGLIAVVVSGFLLIKSILAPIYISRGRRWAWVLALIGSILGTIGGVGMLISGLAVIDEIPWLVLIAVVYLGLYGTLLVLLCTSSARGWIASNRLLQQVEQNPALAQQLNAPSGAPGGGTDQQALVAALQAAMKPSPNKKPGSLVTGQVFMWLLAAVSTALFVFVVYGMREPYFREFLPEEAPLYFPMLGLAAALMLMTLVISVGLAYRAPWSGAGALIGSVVAVALLGTNFGFNLHSQFEMDHNYGFIEDAFLLQLYLTVAAFPLAVTALILFAIPSGRRWIARMNNLSAAPTGGDPASFASPPPQGPPHGY